MQPKLDEFSIDRWRVVNSVASTANLSEAATPFRPMKAMTAVDNISIVIYGIASLTTGR